jgi:hypothetical protein
MFGTVKRDTLGFRSQVEFVLFGLSRGRVNRKRRAMKGDRPLIGSHSVRIDFAFGEGGHRLL